MLPRFADVSLPVPLDRNFTYELPETLRHRVRAGCRMLVPFGARTLSGIVVRVHDERPSSPAKQALRLLAEEPVLDEKLLDLGRWISAYYCCPFGETLRAMAPLAAEVRRSKVYALTDRGRDVTRQLVIGAVSEDPSAALLALLEKRALSSAYLTRKVPQAAALLKALTKKGFVSVEDQHSSHDLLRSPAGKLLVEFVSRGDGKLPRAERELLSYLELHPGSHHLSGLETAVRGASSAARALARRGLIRAALESPAARTSFDRPRHALNPPQSAAFEAIRAAIQAKQFQTFLLYGVTGSGKTEVYLNAIEAALAAGRSALLLVPEIALTPAVAGQFYHRFGDNVAILHSAFHDTERAEQWRRIRRGAARVVVGTRSGVFAPVADLGLLIVDEEHDHSYKQEETPRYNGRDVALVRAQAAGATVVLGSATPSLETRFNAASGKYTLLEMPRRIEGRPLPEVEIIDMRAEFLETRRQATFSRRLLQEIRLRLENREQTMLLLNRRGFSSFVACRACGNRVQCVNCAVTLTYHRRDRRMLCHYCNYAAPVPKVCPECRSEHIYFLGVGSERVEDELHRDLPQARIARMDRDTVTGKRHYETILADFRAGSYDILVGTQMIAKGHDIPNVTLVGVVSADVGLGMPDFRAAERTFQLLTQAAGRAGRGNIPGRVLIQTINPGHYAIRCAATQDYNMFYERELHFRRLMRYPPFSALANVLVRAQQQEDAVRMSAELGRILSPPPENTKVIGPAEAPVPRLKNEYRYQMLIKASSRKRLAEVLRDLRRFSEKERWPATALVIDVDPLALM